jgi:hypothetical protein
MGQLTCLQALVLKPSPSLSHPSLSHPSPSFLSPSLLHPSPSLSHPSPSLFPPSPSLLSPSSSHLPPSPSPLTPKFEEFRSSLSSPYFQPSLSSPSLFSPSLLFPSSTLLSPSYTHIGDEREREGERDLVSPSYDTVFSNNNIKQKDDKIKATLNSEDKEKKQEWGRPDDTGGVRDWC